MSQPTARTMWHLDPEFWSANRAAHRFANGYELVVFDMPAANGYPATIGWELFGGLDYMTLVASGQDASFGEAKDTCEAALVQALTALRHPPKARPACLFACLFTSMKGELSGATPESESWIQTNMAAGIGGSARSRGLGS